MVVDGSIYDGPPHGGIARIYAEILPRMCELNASLAITLLTSTQTRGDVPRHGRIRHVRVPAIERTFRPERLWSRVTPVVRAAVQRAVVGEAGGRVWHSTYYTRPFAWKGPFIVTAVDMIHERLPELFGEDGRMMRRAKRACLEAADAVIAISQTTGDDIRRFYGIASDRIRIVPLACSETFRQGEEEGTADRGGPERPFLLYVGIRSRYKNTDLLLRMYARWRHRKSVDLVVVGRPWTPAERAELVDLGLTERVRLLGHVDDTELRRLYRRAVALVYPSLYEGFGLPLLEAMACGCPVVASRIPATVEVAGDCPIYFDPVDSGDALIAMLDAAFAEARDPERMGRGQARASSYSWDTTAALTLSVYAAVTGRR